MFIKSINSLISSYNALFILDATFLLTYHYSSLVATNHPSTVYVYPVSGCTTYHCRALNTSARIPSHELLPPNSSTVEGECCDTLIHSFLTSTVIRQSSDMT